MSDRIHATQIMSVTTANVVQRGTVLKLSQSSAQHKDKNILRPVHVKPTVTAALGSDVGK